LCRVREVESLRSVSGPVSICPSMPAQRRRSSAPGRGARRSPQEYLSGVRSGFSRAADDERARLSFLTLSFKGAIPRATDREVVVSEIGYVYWDKPGEGPIPRGQRHSLARNLRRHSRDSHARITSRDFH